MDNKFKDLCKQQQPCEITSPVSLPPTPLSSITPKKTRNALLNNIEEKNQLNNIEKLKKIETYRVKLKEICDKLLKNLSEKDNEKNIMDIMEYEAEKLSLNFSFNKRKISNDDNDQQGTNSEYYGEIFIENFKISECRHRKKRICENNTYENAFKLLTSNANLALKRIKSSLHGDTFELIDTNEDQSRTKEKM